MKKIILSFFIFSLPFSLFAQVKDTTILYAGKDTTISLCPQGCANLKATVVPGKSSTDYKIDSIPYAPESFNTGTLVGFSNSNTVSTIKPIGFTFCFFGEPYTDFYIGSNGWMGFSPNQTAYPTSMFSTPPSIPSIDSTKVPRNAIFWLWSNLSIYGSPGVNVYYQMYGTPPNRKMVVSFYKTAPHCLTAHGGPFLSGQIIIYETTNIIELFTDTLSTLCKPGIPREVSVQGLLNKTGTKAVVDPNRNATNWAAIHDGVRYTPIGGTATYTLNWFKTDTTAANKLFTEKDTSTAHQVCPTTTTTYISQLIRNGCPVDTFIDSKVVTVTGGAFPATAAVVSQPTCGQANGSVSVTVTGGTPNYDYVWRKDSVTGSVVSTVTGSASTTNTVTNLVAGKYYITASESKGCIAIDSVTLTTSNGPTPIITGGPLTFCQGGNVLLDAGSGYKSYKWSPGNQTTQTITVTTSGTFSVTVMDANNCSGTSPSKTVTVNPLPTPTITATRPTTFCQGDSTVLDAGIYSSYLWLPTNETTQKITVKTSERDSVTVTDANGCKATASAVKITVNPNPSPVITPNGPTTFCVGDSVQLDAGGPYSTYVWTPPSGNAQNITVKITGNFTVQVTDANGCKGTSLPLTTTIAPNLNVQITPVPAICIGDSIVLNASGATRYLWNTGNSKDTLNQLTIKPSVTTTYIVDGKNKSGSCTGADTIIVTVNPLPVPNVGPDLEICFGESIPLNISGNASYIYSWTPTTTLDNSSYISPTANPKTTTTYIAKVTDNNNCVGYDTVQVTVHPLPTVDAGPDVTISSEETTELKAITLSQGTFVWTPETGLKNPKSQNTIANPQLTTRYRVTLTDTNNCKASDSVVVYKTCGDLYIPNAFSPNGDSLNDVFAVYHIGYTKINMYIFDKWGEKIYEMLGFDKPWDGKVNGEPAQQDVYVYLADAWDCFGQKHKYIGRVTLIR